MAMSRQPLASIKAHEQFLSLVANGDSEGVRSFLAANKIDVNFRQFVKTNSPPTLSDTALATAAHNSNADMMRELLRCPNIDVNAYSTPEDAHAVHKGFTPLLKVICGKQNPECLDLLLESDYINVNLPDATGLTALISLVNNVPEKPQGRAGGQVADPQKQAKSDKLHAILKRLLACPGIDVNVADRKGRTPLMICILKKLKKCVELLLLHEAINVDAVDNDGNTALMLAVEQGAHGAKLLLDSGKVTAEGINLKNMDGKTALDLAHERTNLIEVRNKSSAALHLNKWVNLLKEKGAVCGSSNFVFYY